MNRHFDFLGVNISVINFQEALQQIASLSFKLPAYICFPDAFVVSEASKDPVLRSILNHALFTMPDGKPSQLAARLQGYKQVTTVSGFHLCSALLNSGRSHYFYGGDLLVLQQLKVSIQNKYPHANVLGFKSPPYIHIDKIEGNSVITSDIREINRLRPDFLWIGISSPKQDYLMHYFYRQLEHTLILGVGGAFLYLADEALKSPEWMKKAGLRWLFRLAKEPGRLWPKYYGTLRFLIKNFRFFLFGWFGKKKML